MLSIKDFITKYSDMIKFLSLAVGIFSILLLIFNPTNLFTFWVTFILVFPSYVYFEEDEIGIGTVLFLIGIILAALINNILLPYLLTIL